MSIQNILIVDDDTVIRSSIKEFLENHNYKVCEAGSVKEAVKQDLTAFSLIVCDIKLPGSKGTDLIKLAPGIPVIITSAQASLRDAVETMKLGAADYVAKPFLLTENPVPVRNWWPAGYTSSVTAVTGR
jgi:DNA-binding NtrC family response regulator